MWWEIVGFDFCVKSHSKIFVFFFFLEKNKEIQMTIGNSIVIEGEYLRKNIKLNYINKCKKM